MEDVDVQVGQTTCLAVVVEGKPDPDILWFKVFSSRECKLLRWSKLQHLQGYFLESAAKGLKKRGCDKIKFLLKCSVLSKYLMNRWRDFYGICRGITFDTSTNKRLEVIFQVCPKRLKLKTQSNLFVHQMVKM